jgi:hypothetical protein
MRVARRTDSEINLLHGITLTLWKKQFRAGGFVETGVLDILDHADDGAPWTLKTERMRCPSGYVKARNGVIGADNPARVC